MIKASINLKGTKEKDIPKSEVQKDMERHGFGWNRWSRAWFNARLKSAANPIGRINF